MGDSFAGLWSSSTPASNNKPLSSLSASNVPSSSPQAAYANKRTTPDIFSMLASSGSHSNSNSRPITPQPQRVSPKPSMASTNGDAFSSLLGSSSGTSVNLDKMTIAQRAAHVNKSQQSLGGASAAANVSSSSAWDGLDALGSSNSLNPASSSSAADNTTNDLFEFSPMSAQKSSIQSTPSITVDDDDWGLSDFATDKPIPKQSTPSVSSPPKVSTGGSLWDTHDFAQAHSGQKSRADSPSTGFDFGTREDTGSDDEWGVKRGVGATNYEDDDDVLGDLAKPVDHEAIKRKKAPAETPREPDAPPKSFSPPPHVLGSIVSMGFGVPQAKAALTTSNGNLEAAIEILVGASSSSPRNDVPPRSRPPIPRRPSSQRQQSSENASPHPSDDVGINTDKIISQATEIGTSLFNRAGAMWRQGKEQVQKAYDERATVSNTGQTTSLDGRPKWMRDAPDDLRNDQPSASRMRKPGGYKGDEGTSMEHAPSSQQKPKLKPRPSKPAESEVDLFGSRRAPPVQDARRFVSNEADEVKAYISPFRRKGATPAPSRAPARQAAVPLPHPRQPHPCTQMSISQSQASSAQQQVSRANNAVKLGQYSVAVEAFTAAADSLPSGHVKCLGIFLGRGEARMKDGDSKGAFQDAQGVLAILIPASQSSSALFNPLAWEKIQNEDLGKLYVGALKLRAQGNEAKEKWKDAMGDWERINGLSFASPDVRSEASRGRGRCKGMLEPKPAASTSRPPLKVYKPKVETSGEAVKELRKANKAQESEEDEKFRLKDTVDAKIIAWKGGKETNIRALLGSLDMVLWPEMGLKKIGLHELVQEKQVKICYMRAVGRVHPDKINPSNSTLEQRMIANAVFGTLNEAWNSHKA